MSKPKRVRKNSDCVGSAMIELLHAESALNMPDEQIEGSAGAEWISEKYKWAAHAVDHINAALRFLQAAKAKEQHHL